MLDTLEKSKIYEAGASAQFDDWYANFLMPAALLVLAGLILRSTRMLGAP